MLFNADRNTKDNLFNYYKKEANDHLMRKNEIKKQMKDEDRMYLDSVVRREKEEEERKRNDKMRIANEYMSEYNEMIRKNDDKKRRNEEMKFNTYGVSFNQNFNKNYPINNNKTQYTNDYEQFQRNEKFEMQRNYKELLDSQINSKDCFNVRSNNNFVKKSSNTYSLVNPYSKKTYDIGGSILSHNPILNPTNNFSYNKYLNIGNQNFKQNQNALYKENSNTMNISNTNSNMNHLNYPTDPQPNPNPHPQEVPYNPYQYEYNKGNINEFPQDAQYNQPNYPTYENVNYNYPNYNSYSLNKTPSNNGDTFKNAANNILK